ncbi:MAG: type II toxin-antitoxin system RelB/DinJ family antitoxin [Coriobacteriales bacterium]|jgi:DNA-damage-inducible protein J|nr:type II toxin-antitoxin system RelB/DinJ family antitoxin [Coriobacteriales bacterium]
MATVSVRIDDSTKNRLDEFSRSVGLNTSALIKMFAAKVAQEQRIPFDVEIDPFYSSQNMNELKRRAANIAAGRNCHEHELIEVD